MFSVIINDVEVEFSGSISLVKNNPIFSDEVNHSLQFSVSADSEINRRAYGYIDLPETLEATEREFSCIINADSIRLVGTVTSKFQNGNFVNYFKESGSFYSQIKDKKLSNIPFDKIVFENELDYQGLAAIMDELPIDFPVMVYGKASSKFPVRIQFYDQHPRKFLANYGYSSPNLGYYHIPMIPVLRLKYILYNIFEKLGLEIEDNVFTQPLSRYFSNEKIPGILSSLSFASNYMINEFSVDYSVNESHSIFSQNNIIVSIQNSQEPEVVTRVAHGLPNYCIIYIKNAIPSINNRLFQVEVVDATTFKLLNEDFSSLDELDQPAGVGNIWPLNPIQSRFKEINPANHVPDMLIADFLTDIEKLGIYCFVEGNKVSFNLIKDIVNSPEYVDISSLSGEITDIENKAYKGFSLKFSIDSNCEYTKRMLPFTQIDSKYKIKDPVNKRSDLIYAGSETNDVRLLAPGVESDNDVYMNGFFVFNKGFINADNNWKFLVHNNLDNIQGDGSFEVSTKFSPALTDREHMYFGDSYYFGFAPFARLDIPCNCKTFFDESLKNNPRLVAVRNYATQTGIGIFATSDSLRYDGFDLGDFSVSWQGEKSIYNLFLKEYLDWQTRTRKDCIAKIIWTTSDFLNFKLYKKARIYGVDYLVKSIKYTIDFKNKRINLSDTELAKV